MKVKKILWFLAKIPIRITTIVIILILAAIMAIYSILMTIIVFPFTGIEFLSEQTFLTLWLEVIIIWAEDNKLW